MKHLGKHVMVAGIAWVLLSACGKDDTGGCNSSLGWAALVADESFQLSETATAYNNDPSPQNCAAYKNAYNVYLEALIDLQSCFGGSNYPGYQQSLKDSQLEIDQLCQ